MRGILNALAALELWIGLAALTAGCREQPRETAEPPAACQCGGGCPADCPCGCRGH